MCFLFSDFSFNETRDACHFSVVLRWCKDMKIRWWSNSYHLFKDVKSIRGISVSYWNPIKVKHQTKHGDCRYGWHDPDGLQHDLWYLFLLRSALTLADSTFQGGIFCERSNSEMQEPNCWTVTDDRLMLVPSINIPDLEGFAMRDLFNTCIGCIADPRIQWNPAKIGIEIQSIQVVMFTDFCAWCIIGAGAVVLCLMCTWYDMKKGILHVFVCANYMCLT